MSGFNSAVQFALHFALVSFFVMIADVQSARGEVGAGAEAERANALIEGLKDIERRVPIDELFNVSGNLGPHQTDVIHWRLVRTVESVSDVADVESLLKIEEEVDALLVVFLSRVNHRSYFSEVIALERLFARKLYKLPAYTERWAYLLNQTYLFLVSQFQQLEQQAGAQRAAHLQLNLQFLQTFANANSASRISDLIVQFLKQQGTVQFAPSGELIMMPGMSSDQKSSDAVVEVGMGFEADLIRPQFKIQNATAQVDLPTQKRCELILDVSGPPSKYRLN